MKIQISQPKKTWAIKRTFSRTFPYLKIEFFKSPHDTGEASSAKSMIKVNKSLVEINPLLKDGIIDVQENDTVASVERRFQDFGLPVQIFRKQNNVWLETTATDQLTLAEQNDKGSSASVSAHQDEPVDRYLQDGQYS